MNDNAKAILVIGGLIVAGLLCLFFPGCHYSDGDRVGYVVKLSRKGLVFPTWEGDMQLGGVSPTDGGSVSASVWHFSVRSDEVAAMLRKAMEDGRRLHVRYVEWLARGNSYGSTGYDVTEVKGP